LYLGISDKVSNKTPPFKTLHTRFTTQGTYDFILTVPCKEAEAEEIYMARPKSKTKTLRHNKR